MCTGVFICGDEIFLIGAWAAFQSVFFLSCIEDFMSDLEKENVGIIDWRGKHPYLPAPFHLA